MQHTKTYPSQNTTTQCNTMQYIATQSLQDTTLKCRLHTATNFLQHTATRWQRTYFNTLQHIATHCNTLQHTAKHCKTLRVVSIRGSSQVWVFLNKQGTCWDGSFDTITSFCTKTRLRASKIRAIRFQIYSKKNQSFCNGWLVGFELLVVSQDARNHTLVVHERSDSLLFSIAR